MVSELSVAYRRWRFGTTDRSELVAAYRAYRFNPHHGKDGKFASADAHTFAGPELEPLAPGGWDFGIRDQTKEMLKTTPQGDLLVDSVDKIQSGQTDARLRTDIENELNGKAQAAKRKERALNLVDAIDKSTVPVPPHLYRGMAVRGSVDEVMARYAPGKHIDMSLASYSTDRKIAEGYAEKTRQAGYGGTKVFMDWEGGGHALPIEKLSPNNTLFSEHEWLTNGRFEVVGQRYDPGKGHVVLTVRQRSNLHVHNN